MTRTLDTPGRVTTWFASDHRFGHERIRAFEPAARGGFASTDEMNDAIVAVHDALVAPDDPVHLLGDLAMGDLARSMRWATRLHGRKRLVAGNHDRHSAAYERLRPVDEGLPLVHGHVHSLWRVRGRMLDVGIDANALAPTSEHEVRAWLAGL